MITLKYTTTTVDGAGNKNHFFDIDTWEPHAFKSSSGLFFLFMGPEVGGYANGMQWDSAGRTGGAMIGLIDTISIPTVLLYANGSYTSSQPCTTIWRHIYIPDGPTYLAPAFRPRYTGILAGLSDDISTRYIPLTTDTQPHASRCNLASDPFSVENNNDLKAPYYIGQNDTDVATSAKCGHYIYKRNVAQPSGASETNAPWLESFSAQPTFSGYISAQGYVTRDPINFIDLATGILGVPFRTHNIHLPTGEYDLGGELFDPAHVLHDPTA